MSLINNSFFIKNGLVLVYSCGLNNNGQLGLGDTTSYNIPTLISSLSDINFLQDVINNLIIKLLIQDGNNIEIPQDNNLLKVGSLPYTLDLFKTYGMNGLSVINSSIIDKLNNNKYNIGLSRKK